MTRSRGTDRYETSAAVAADAFASPARRVLLLTGLEFGIVAWAAKRRQDLEARRAEHDS